MASLVRQNYHTDTEAAINKQIYIEMHASYVYHSMVRFVSDLIFYLLTLLAYLLDGCTAHLG